MNYDGGFVVKLSSLRSPSAWVVTCQVPGLEIINDKVGGCESGTLYDCYVT